MICYLQEICLKYKDTDRLKVKEDRKMYYAILTKDNCNSYINF